MNGIFEGNLKELRIELERLKNVGMQVNATKTFWARNEVEQLGFTINQEKVKHQKKRIEAIIAVKSQHKKAVERIYRHGFQQHSDDNCGRNNACIPKF